MSEESDRVSLSLCLSSRYAVTHSSPSTHYERPKGGEGVGHGTRDHGGREDSDRETNRKDPRLFWSLLFPLVSRGSSLISSPHPSSPHRHPRSGPEGGGDGG